jgi:hypothetical protein
VYDALIVEATNYKRACEELRSMALRRVKFDNA